ncbi:Bug family tripartite tricarboxylate transporter substrate binding protein [Idiomarina abyssalis]|uniref:Bug family tripartite tricarboxylate transporter substrate binding protein n=1 Tax=Idiomarina abyssalis TaxID=86102 RepID=UPI003A94E945
MNIKKTILLSVVTATIAMPFATAQADSYPSKDLNYVIAFGPGGGNDTMSRTLVDVLKKNNLVNGQNFRVENRAGGSGAIGFNYVAQKKGNPYYLTSTSGNFIGTPIVSNTGWTYKDFTPIGLLAQDAMFLSVRADSPYKTLKEFIQASKTERLKVGGTGAAGPERVVAAMLEKSADTKFVYVPSQDDGGLTTSLTSGSVDAIVSNPAEVAGQVAAGNFRPLAYSEGIRSTVFPDVPTFIEQGYDVAFSLPRGVVLPGGVSKDVQAWWVATLKKAVKTPEWKTYLKKKGLSGNTVWGDQFGTYLEQTDLSFRATLKDVGVLK